MVIELYGLELAESIEDVHGGQTISDELKITTHYEALDIAQSNRIHYISFRLPTQRLEDLDKKLHELVFENEEATG